MILNVRVIPRSGRKIIQEEKGFIRAYLTQPAIDGLANKQLIELLADHFNIRKYMVRVVRGEKSRDKVVEIDIR